MANDNNNSGPRQTHGNLALVMNDNTRREPTNISLNCERLDGLLGELHGEVAGAISTAAAMDQVRRERSNLYRNGGDHTSSQARAQLTLGAVYFRCLESVYSTFPELLTPDTKKEMAQYREELKFY